MIPRFYRSSIGKKWVVAITGLVLVAYVIGHLLGNLQIFFGVTPINRYAEFLHGLGPVLWGIRAFLLAALLLHIGTTILLAIENRAARPTAYAVNTSVQARTATKTMLVGGLVVLCFVVYHLLHFTTRTALPLVAAPGATAVERLGADSLDAVWRGEDADHRHHVYNMVVAGFQNPVAAAFYMAGVLLLSLHLSHGFGSLLQTLGLNNRKLAGPLLLGGQALACLIGAGYLIVPVAVLAGLLKLQ